MQTCLGCKNTYEIQLEDGICGTCESKGVHRCETCGEGTVESTYSKTLGVTMCSCCDELYKRTGLKYDGWFGEDWNRSSSKEAMEQSHEDVYRIDTYYSGFSPASLDEKRTYSAVRVFRYFKNGLELNDSTEYVPWEGGNGYDDAPIPADLKEKLDSAISFCRKYENA